MLGVYVHTPPASHALEFCCFLLLSFFSLASRPIMRKARRRLRQQKIQQYQRQTASASLSTLVIPIPRGGEHRQAGGLSVKATYSS